MKRTVKIANRLTERSGVTERYMAEVKRVGDTITTEKEVELFERLRAGDETVKKEIAYAHLRFVISVAKLYSSPNLSLDDLISAGNAGLMLAIDKFDEKRGFKFISYAVWWIRQSILAEIANNGRFIRLPLNIYGQMVRSEAALSRIEVETGFRDESAIEDYRNYSYTTPASLNKTYGDNDIELAEVLRGEDGEESMLRMFGEERVRIALRCIPEKYSDILRRFYGIGVPQEELKQIAESYGRSTENMRLRLKTATRFVARALKRFDALEEWPRPQKPAKRKYSPMQYGD